MFVQRICNRDYCEPDLRHLDEIITERVASLRGGIASGGTLDRPLSSAMDTGSPIGRERFKVGAGASGE